MTVSTSLSMDRWNHLYTYEYEPADEKGDELAETRIHERVARAGRGADTRRELSKAQRCHEARAAGEQIA